MKLVTWFYKIIIIILFFSSTRLLFAQIPYPTDLPHWGRGIDCGTCHAPHRNPDVLMNNLKGNANVCLSCHNEGSIANKHSFSYAQRAVPGVSGTSHAWDVLAENFARGAQLPQNPEMAGQVREGFIACSTCHDQHRQRYKPFLRTSNEQNAMCKDCHRVRDVGLFRDAAENRGSHPVGIEYPLDDPRFRTAPADTSLQLVDGNRVECTSCHAVHDADSGGANEGLGDGNLLRAKNDSNLCKTCHAYNDHMGRDCLSCHQVHKTSPENIYLVSDSISTGEDLLNPVVFTAQSGQNSFADGSDQGTSICAVCHMSTLYHRADGASITNHHPGENCTDCHKHEDAFMPTGKKHPQGWVNSSSPVSHGKFIRSTDWDLQQCRACHGQDYAGGFVNVSCLTCHPSTPEGCNVCHGGVGNNSGAPPEDIDGNHLTSARGVGAHAKHLSGGNLSEGFSCKTCHTVPEAFDDTGHVDSNLPAELNFTGLAVQDGATPQFDGQTCQNSYCHGNFSYGNNSNAPQWTKVDGTQAACGTCHTLPPGGNHPNNDQCSVCHGVVVDTGNNIINKALHINGKVDVSTEDCLACHNQSPPVSSTDSRRRQIVEQFAGQGGGDFVKPSHHVTNNLQIQIVQNADCKTCHDQAQHTTFGDGVSVLLKNVDGGSSIQFNGSPASAESFCTACHDSAGDSFPSSNASAPVVAQNWDGSSHAQSNKASCLDCHAQGHGSAFSNLLAATVAGNSVANPQEALCFACHKSDGRASSNIQSQFSLASRHNVSSADQNDGSKVECNNCHNPHFATSTNTLADPNTGGNASWNCSKTAFCSTCHDGSAPAGVQFPASSPGTGLNKSTFPGTRHANSLGGDACIRCHEPHGSSYFALTKANYVRSDNNSFQSGDYLACWQCHSENYIMNQINAFSKYHDKHVNKEKTPCITCHDTHAPYDNGESGLINFNYALQHGFDLQLANGRNLSTVFEISGNKGSCYLTCHGEKHKPETYTRYGNGGDVAEKLKTVAEE